MPVYAAGSGLSILFGELASLAEAAPAGHACLPHPDTALLTCDSPHPPLTRLDSDSGILWCLGELFSYDGADGDTAACLRRAAADWGAEALKPDRLNGRFVLLRWDQRASEWQIVTDRIGSCHLYSVWEGDRVRALGSDLLTLSKAASRRALDWEAIATFFALGFYLDDRTCFTDVRVLLPASLYRLSPAGDLLAHRRTWAWHHTVDAARSYDETVEQYDVLLRQAVRRITQTGQTIVPLSGGLDSRSLAAVLPRGADTLAYSYGYTPDSIETAIAARIARERGFAFTRHVIRPYLFERLPELVRTLHGCQDVTQARQMSINGWVHERADAVLTGLWGDVWCDQTGLADGLPPGETVASHALHKMQKRGRDWLLEHVAGPQLGGQSIPDLLEDRVRTGVAAFAGIADPDFQAKVYKTSRWAFRWSNASLRGFEPGGVPRVAYYDIDLVDFFCTVPTAFARDRKLQIDHLKRFAPDLARIFWQEAEANLYLAPYGRWLSLPRRAFHRLRRSLRGERPIQRNWEVQFLAPGGREGLEEWLLRPGLRLHDVAAPEAVRALVDGLYAAPEAANGYAVSMLLTFSAWLEAAV